ncbi:MAG: type II secretion system protein [Pyrinomonadaceae bacterium]|nr:type II secretion system protein [Phycisphaerales bacterium]
MNIPGPQIDVAAILVRGVVENGPEAPHAVRPLDVTVRGFTLVELLFSLGIIGVLLGLLAPSISSARESARRTRCLAQLGGHMQVLSAYAGDYRDAWPFAFNHARQVPEEWPAHPEVRFWNSYNLIDGLWHLPVLDAYNENPFHESLICPSDKGETLASRQSAAEHFGVDVQKIRGTLKYRLSMAMYLDSRALNPASPRFESQFFVGQTQSAVSFPSNKAALYEGVALHDRSVPDPYEAARPVMLTVAGADGAVKVRSTSTMAPGIVFPGFFVAGFADQQAEMNKLRFTPMGVFGRDW